MIGKPEPSDFWAKLDHDGDGNIIAWHSLFAHCADVAAVAEALLTHSILGRRHARLLRLDALTDGHIQRLAALVALHDSGKVNHGFQRRAFTEPGPRAGHVGPILNFFFESNSAAEAGNALGVADFATWFLSQEQFFSTLYSSLSHHGRPVAAESPRDLSLWRANNTRNPITALAHLRAKIDAWFPLAFDPEIAPFDATPAFQHAFNGLVTLADWIGSNKNIFTYSEDDSHRMVWARNKAREAVEKLGLDVSTTRASLGATEPGFDSVTAYPPYEIQQTCLDLPLYPEGSLTILESDTGSGKTEAVLARFLRLFHAGLVDGLYFALPTRTAATQIYERVNHALKRAFPEDQAPPVILAVPGYLRVDGEDGHRASSNDPLLPSFEVLWPDDDKERRRYRGWAVENSKRYLAGTVGVGTVDQVLLSTLQVSHAHLRATSSLRHLLVVDEVHASDAYMTTLLEEVLDRHLEAGGHAILMSATLGTKASSRFLHTARPSASEATQLAYPLLHHAPASRAKVQQIPAGATDYEKRVIVDTTPVAADPEAIARRALEAAKNGARVLVIRNLVKDCMATQTALESLCDADAPELFRVEGVPTAHHSRFAAADRKKLDNQIEIEFGKESTRRGVIVVATQTVEQSLDLDADLLLTDLCPMDVLLQRIGRLHRHHKRIRPDAFLRARTVILVPEIEGLGDYLRDDGTARGQHGLGTIYRDLRVLEATRREITNRKEWVLPTMNRSLVEAATHPENLRRLVDELGGLWTAHTNEVRGANSGDRSVARIKLIQRDKPFMQAIYARDNRDRRPKTRLGLEDRRVTFPQPVMSPFGSLIFELTIPEHLARNADRDAELAEDIHQDGGLWRFRFGGARYQYGRLGLQLDD